MGKKSIRYYFDKKLNNRYYQQSQTLNNPLGRLSSDPDELLDQIKLLYFEKVGENDNPQLNEQIIAIADILLEYEFITPSQHQNMRSTFDGKKDSFEH